MKGKSCRYEIRSHLHENRQLSEGVFVFRHMSMCLETACGRTPRNGLRRTDEMIQKMGDGPQEVMGILRKLRRSGKDFLAGRFSISCTLGKELETVSQ